MELVRDLELHRESCTCASPVVVVVLIRQREHKPDSVSVTPEKSQVHIELLSGHCLDSLSRRKDSKVERVPRWISVRLERVEGVFDRLSRAVRDAERLRADRSYSRGKLSVSLRRTKREKCTDWLPLRPRSRKPRELDLSTGKTARARHSRRGLRTGRISCALEKKQRQPLSAHRASRHLRQ